jgi:hypothetical protein
LYFSPKGHCALREKNKSEKIAKHKIESVFLDFI